MRRMRDDGRGWQTITVGIAAVFILVVPFMLGCGERGASSRTASGTGAASAASAASASASTAPGNGGCPANGLWAECSVVYRLERAGLAPRVDSGATPNEKTLTGTPLMLKIGLSARLELHLYPDSVARVTDTRTLDRARFVTGTAPQTIKRERTLIESANLVGLLTSINAHQRERVADALLAGPPQPERAVAVPGPVAK